MELKEIFSDQYEICAVTNRGDCPFEDAIFNETEDAFRASRANIVNQLLALASEGFRSERYTSRRVDEKYDIWEIKADKLRAFYFKGNHPTIIICTELLIKQKGKVDPKAVDRAIRLKKLYVEAIAKQSLIVIKGDDYADE